MGTEATEMPGDAYEGPLPADDIDPSWVPHVARIAGGDCGGVVGGCPYCKARFEIGNQCRAAALEYLRLGLSVVAVCPPDHACCKDWHTQRPHACKTPGKVPYGRWKERQRTLPTKQDIEQAWKRNHFCNVGVALGPVSGIIRVDIDGPAGELMLKEVCGEMPVTWEFTSGGGGRGLIYAIPIGVTLKTTPRKAEGIHAEARYQAKGAQTVLPPSLHSSGRRYTWLLGRNPPAMKPTQLPPALVELMNLNGNRGKKTNVSRRRIANCGNEAAAIEAVYHLNTSRADHYEEWLNVGMALHSVSDSLLPVWESWSRLSSKFRDGECESKWASFTRGGSITIASLIYWARQDTGWRPRPSSPNGLHANGTHESKGKPAARTSPSSTITLTDLGNGKRFARTHGAVSRYCHRWRKWLYWDETRWKLDDTGYAMVLAKDVILGLYEWAQDRIESLKRNESNDASKEELKRVKAVLDWAYVSQSAPRLNAMIELAKSELGIPVQPTDLDRDPMLFNVANGTLDLATGKLLPHRQDDYITKLCPTRFDPAATCPTWERVLYEVFATCDSVISYMQRLAGYWLTGLVEEHAMPVLWGAGANGKSVIIQALFDVMGSDYAGKAPRDLLVATKTDKHPTSTAWLHGKRFVAAIETGEGARLDEALVKELTGGDVINARRMREDYWEFRPSHKLAIITNHRPNVRGTDHAIWRRLRLIPFTVIFSEAQQDKRLGEKLRDEASGILNWLLAGCLQWQQQGLADPSEILDATKDYREAEDRLGEFLAEHCEIRQGSDSIRVKKNILYARYRAWCEASGERWMNATAFGLAIKERGIATDIGRRWYTGVTLINEDDE